METTEQSCHHKYSNE